jgi:FecR protein
MAQKSRSRAALEIAAVVAIVLAGAWFVFRHTLYQPPPPPPVVAVETPAAPVAPAAPAPPPVEDALVSAVVGDVQRVDPAGSASALSVGDRLRVSDSLRTGKGARTDLEIGAGSKLTVGEGTQLTVREINNQVHRLKLTKGRITADYKGGDRSLRIENETGDTVAETKGARFSLLSNGTSLAVATAEGAVDLTAKEKTVQVGAGQQAVALAGEAPSAAEPIPAALLLKVADASASKHVEGLCAEVDGQAPSGTEVLIDGTPLAIARDGHFRVKVPRDPKDKLLVLVALRDAMGRETTRKVPCETDPQIDDMAIRWKRRKATP